MIELLNIDCMETPLVRKGVRGFQKGHKNKSFLGKKHSEETKKKMREARLNNQPMHKQEVVAKRSATLREKGTFAKEKGNTWKGGVTPEQVLARNSDEYKKWRDAVFQRDDYSCRHCLDRCCKGNDVYLHAHHLKSFSSNPELRFEVSNGITLCKKCHYKVHSNVKN